MKNKTEKIDKENKTNWHRLWGLMVTPLFEKLDCEVTVELDLSVKVQRLDMVVVTQKEPKPISFYDVNPDYYQGFETLNEHNLISFKSFNESFNMTAIEEFYGHFTNYKKMRNLEDTPEKINLYAVTHHFPEKLFSRYKNTEFLECISENRIYDFKVFTPVRFIITNNFDHPILGLFSNKTEQIEKSTERLKQDDWLLENVSSYLNELYNHYSLEGVNMPYTREMFVKEYHPEYYQDFLLGRQEGLQKGIQKGLQKGLEEGEKKGELIGSITALQKILKCKTATKKELRAKSIEELKAMLKELEKQIK
jgi:hypothetical protein